METRHIPRAAAAPVLGRRLRVLFVTSWFPRRERPLEGVFVREHARAVQLYDDVVVLHCAGLDGGLRRLFRTEREADETLTEGLPTYRTWYRRLIPGFTFAAYVAGVVGAARNLAREGFRPDIIHGHVHDVGIPAVVTARLMRAPVVITEHYSGFAQKQLSGRELLKARLAFARADRVLPVSRVLREALQASGIRARFQIVPNVVDTGRFHPVSRMPHGGRRRILFVGQLVPVKGLPVLLRALAVVNRSRTDWHLDVIGEGPERPRCDGLIADLGLDTQVAFHPPAGKDHVAAFMYQADVFVLPSLIETFSVVAAEAAATGLPVVATRCGGPEEVMPEGAATFVPPGDPQALAAALLAALEAPVPQTAGGAADRIADRLSPRQVGRELHLLYLTLLASRGRDASRLPA